MALFTCSILTISACQTDSSFSQSNSLPQELTSEIDEFVSNSSKEVQIEHSDVVESNINVDLSTEEIALKALKKWEMLGGSYDFKNIEDLDSQKIANIYGHYVLFNEMDYRLTADWWLDISGFDAFIKDYFDLSPLQFHTGTYYDSQKGIKLPKGIFIVKSENQTCELLDCKKNSDGTYSLTAKFVFSHPEALVGEDNVVVRLVNLTYKYENENIFFIEASYEQDGIALK